MARYWIVRRYGRYVTDQDVDATYDNAKEALMMYDKACKYEASYSRKFDTTERAIALFKYDPSARYNMKTYSVKVMIYYSQKPLPGWPGVRYRNVKDKGKEKTVPAPFGL